MTLNSTLPPKKTRTYWNASHPIFMTQKYLTIPDLRSALIRKKPKDFDLCDFTIPSIPRKKKDHHIHHTNKFQATLPEINSKSPWKWAETQKETIVFPPSIFRGELLVSGSVIGILSQGKSVLTYPQQTGSSENHYRLSIHILGGYGNRYGSQ